MNFLEIMQNRYTTKKYDASKKIPNNEISKLKEILHLSPSSINSQPWTFTFISEEKTKKALAQASYFNKDKVLNADHVIVFSVINNIKLFEKQIEENLAEGSVNYYKNFLKPKTEEEIKAWLSHQVYISLGVFLSACAVMKIDSTPMEGIISEEYASILKLDDYNPLFAVAIGYRDHEDANQLTKKPKSRLEYDNVISSIE